MSTGTNVDNINHPAHYTANPSGVECIDVVEHMNFNRGNAVKYIWRAGQKGDELDDLHKAAWYINREIERVTKERYPLRTLENGEFIPGAPYES